MKEIPKTYEPGKYEDGIYELWEKSGFFSPDNLDLPKDAKTFTIVLPPPNITDKLHLGHSAMLAIEDLLIRFHRMKGDCTLWIPGTDHAAIATQNAVEKKILKETGKTRHDLGKEKFLEEVWKFLRVTQATILKQTRKMGASLDWSREAFTLDDARKKAVKKMFVEMHKEGLIYRGERIVNWCPRCHSTLSDDEVEYEKEIGKLYWIKYGPFVLATTRPETKLGDTAVAVYPGDKRYEKMVGKKYKIPGVLGEFEIIVVADRAVDPKFGSGAIKVTPAHDFTDNEIAMRHKISTKQVINEDGKMMKNCGKYAGLTTDEARKEIVKDMKKMGLIDRVEEDYEHNIAVCYRCAAKIEPIPSRQWFISMDKKIKRLGGKSLKERALKAAEKKEISFIPNRFEKRYVDWTTSLHDWCISRQIWFGHEIPVWYKTSPQPSPYKGEGTKEEIYVGENAPKGEGWIQDPDTLDTWFSSGMWTFSTLGWPKNYKNGKKTGDLLKFHPTQVLETGYDILTLWVSRMIIMTLFALGEVPFEKVYLHGLVLDKFGKKMSKSKGNGIDPMDMIKLYGADAVRLSLLIGTTPGNDVRIFPSKIESFRNYITKIWNIYRFASSACSDLEIINGFDEKNLKTLSDQWIISRIHKVTAEITENLNNYKFSLAGEKLQKFVWGDLADWYLEISKIEKNMYVINYVINYVIRLMHPFAPFVTEKIWQDIFGGKRILMVEKWPISDEKLINEKAEEEFSALQEIIAKIRNIRSSYRIDPAKFVNVFADKFENKEIIEKLARIKFSDKKIEKGIDIASKDIKITLDIFSMIDVKKKIRLKKEIENLEKLVVKNEKLLTNKKFAQSAPEVVISQNKNNLKEYREKLKTQKQLFKNLK